jgi:hypothetical protein
VEDTSAAFKAPKLKEIALMEANIFLKEFLDYEWKPQYMNNQLLKY